MSRQSKVQKKRQSKAESKLKQGNNSPTVTDIVFGSLKREPVMTEEQKLEKEEEWIKQQLRQMDAFTTKQVYDRDNESTNNSSIIKSSSTNNNHQKYKKINPCITCTNKDVTESLIERWEQDVQNGFFNYRKIWKFNTDNAYRKCMDYDDISIFVCCKQTEKFINQIQYRLLKKSKNIPQKRSIEKGCDLTLEILIDKMEKEHLRDETKKLSNCYVDDFIELLYEEKQINKEFLVLRIFDTNFIKNLHNQNLFQQGEDLDKLVISYQALLKKNEQKLEDIKWIIFPFLMHPENKDLSHFYALCYDVDNAFFIVLNSIRQGTVFNTLPVQDCIKLKSIFHDNVIYFRESKEYSQLMKNIQRSLVYFAKSIKMEIEYVQKIQNAMNYFAVEHRAIEQIDNIHCAPMMCLNIYKFLENPKSPLDVKRVASVEDTKYYRYIFTRILTSKCFFIKAGNIDASDLNSLYNYINK